MKKRSTMIAEGPQMKMIKNIVLLVIVLMFTEIAGAADQRLMIFTDAIGAETAAELAGFLKKKELSPEMVSSTTVVKTAPVLLLFGSTKPGGAAAGLMTEALKDGLAETQADMYSGLIVRQHVWAKDQLLLMFIGHNPRAIKNAVADSRENWNDVLGSRFEVQLSEKSFYGY